LQGSYALSVSGAPARKPETRQADLQGKPPTGCAGATGRAETRDRHRDGAEHAALQAVLFGRRNGLASVELGATVGELDHDGGLELGGSLENLVDAGRAHAVDGWDCVVVVLGVLEQVLEGVTVDHAWLDRVRQLLEVLTAAA